MWNKEKLLNYLDKCKEIHNNKYDYSKVDLIENIHSKITIICPEHGEFTLRADHHKSGHGCPECKKESLRKQKLMSVEEFIDRSNFIHNNKYNYSLVKQFKNNSEKVKIICPIHGEFEQRVSVHLLGHGCLKCMSEKLSELKRDSLQDVLQKAREIHKNKYEYDESIEYINCYTKLKIKCPKHGWFYLSATQHLRGQGCPICKESNLEIQVRELLESNNINFEYQKKFDWMDNLSLDFYIPDKNLAIECQGILHFIPVDFFGGKLQFKRLVYNDINKFNLCKKHNILIIYYTVHKVNNYPYTLISNLDDLLFEIDNFKMIK